MWQHQWQQQQLQRLRQHQNQQQEQSSQQQLRLKPFSSRTPFAVAPRAVPLLQVWLLLSWPQLLGFVTILEAVADPDCLPRGDPARVDRLVPG